MRAQEANDGVGIARAAAALDLPAAQAQTLGHAATRRSNDAQSVFSVLAGVAALCAILAAVPAQADERLSADAVRAAVRDAPAGKIDLSGKDMSGADLSGLDLSGANLAGANLSGANLHGVKLVGATLTEANLAKADLTGTWIMNANFDRANLSGATLQVVVTAEAMDN